MTGRLPVTIVTGFLGAGKTTLLSNLINQCQDVHVAVVVNEFGTTSIDDAILRRKAQSKSIEFHSIKNSLIAYAEDEQFDQYMSELAKRDDLDHILIETSGLAVPSAIIEKIQSPPLADRFVVDATLLVVDTPLLLAQGQFDSSNTQAAQEVFKAQLECSDVVILNKIDDLNESQLLQTEALLRSKSSQVRFIELAYDAEIDRKVALGLKLNEPTAIPSRVPVPVGAHRATKHTNGHEHSGLGAHKHGIHTHQHIHEHDPGWMSFILRSEDQQDQEALKAVLQKVSQTEPILRIKGNVVVGGVVDKLLYQGVGMRLNIEPSKSNSDHDTDSELVFIGYHLSREHILEHLNKGTKTVWV